jgi:hypothetical protein
MPPVIGIVVIGPASVMALTVAGSADIHRNATGADVHTLS